MAFTKAHARITLGMLDDEQLAAMKFMANPVGGMRITQDTVTSLADLDLVRQDINLLTGKPVLLLNSRGKKVAEEIRKLP